MAFGLAHAEAGIHVSASYLPNGALALARGFGACFGKAGLIRVAEFAGRSRVASVPRLRMQHFIDEMDLRRWLAIGTLWESP